MRGGENNLSLITVLCIRAHSRLAGATSKIVSKVLALYQSNAFRLFALHMRIIKTQRTRLKRLFYAPTADRKKIRVIVKILYRRLVRFIPPSAVYK